MPNPTIAANNAAAVKKWNGTVMTDHLRGALLEPLMGTSEDAVIQVLPEVETSSTGDEFTFHYRPALDRTTGVDGSDVLKGKEQDLTLYTDKVTLDERANAIAIRNFDISQKRTVVNLKDQQFTALQDWLIERNHLKMMQQLLSTATGRVRARYLYGAADGNWNATEATAKGNVDAINDLLTVEMLVLAKQKAQLEGSAKMRPANVSRDMDMPVESFVFLGHPYAVRRLTKDPEWRNAEYFSEVASNKRHGGAFYKGTIEGVSVYEMPESNMLEAAAGAGGITIAHGLLLGAQAACVGYGMEPEFRPDNDDYDRIQNLGVISIQGEKKTVFNGEDFAAVHIYSAY